MGPASTKGTHAYSACRRERLGAVSNTRSEEHFAYQGLARRGPTQESVDAARVGRPALACLEGLSVGVLKMGATLKDVCRLHNRSEA
jgi:hypothetical protein